MPRVRQHFGKYVIERRLAEGGYAAVYQARDTIEGIRVALKIPYPLFVTKEWIKYFRQEIRLVARLHHPHILPLKNAEQVDGQWVIVTALGAMTLGERLQKRVSVQTALDYTGQMLSAVAYAHEQRIVHCDIKPDNFLIFSDNQVRLADFGIARVALRTLRGSGAGTVGYCAPEQAVGKPSFRSDVFSLGLVVYRMLTGELPEWPYEWPHPGHARLRRRVPAEWIDWLRRATELDPRKRFRDARQMQSAFRTVVTACRRQARAQQVRSAQGANAKTNHHRHDWQEVRRNEFRREYGKILEVGFNCESCNGPVSETMRACPWCGKDRAVHREGTGFPAHCPRCHRGIKLDWQYCPWCYGGGFEPITKRQYDDRRYSARCTNGRCSRKLLMPFMKYCPWCRRRVRRRWQIEGSADRCPHCCWGFLPAYWNFCAWCGKRPIK